jgi:hypothetical protein
MKKLSILMLTLTMMLVNSGTAQIIFEDDFTTFSGWTYDPGNCPGFAVASDGNMLYVQSYGSCSPGGDQFEGIVQVLSQPITPDQDFTVCFKPVVLTDPPGQMGGVQVSCLNDADEVVAIVKWYEPQAGTGFGGVSFYAEGNLIYGNESGFDTEYPTINDALCIHRIEDHWSGWVNGIQKGTDFILTPTKTISKVKIGFYNFVNWPERDIKVDFISLTSSQLGWCDDFESYPLGSFPTPPWFRSGNNPGAFIDDSVSVSGNQSMHLYGIVGGCWSVSASRQIGIEPPFMIEFKIYIGSELTYGCHPQKGALFLRCSPNWWDCNSQLMYFGNDGRVCLADSLGWHYEELQWIPVKVHYSRLAEDSVRLAYWVNNELLYETDMPALPHEDALAFVSLVAEEGTVWFDDICVSPLIGPLHVSLDIKPGSCPNPLNVKHKGFYAWSEDTETETQLAASMTCPYDPGKKGAVLPVAILGTEEFDVADIDVSTVMLEGVAPIRSSYEDVATPVDDTIECACTTDGPDGYQDLTLKFDRAAIIAALGEVHDGDVIPLTIIGELNDGTAIEGTDCVVIRGDREAVEGAPQSEGEPEIQLIGNYPNPFNPTTEISFSLSQASHVKLEIFNIMGQHIETLVDGYREVGVHSVIWDGSAVASGVYLYRLEAGDFVEAKKMMLLK